MLVGAPFVEAQQHSPVGIEDLPKVVMGWKSRRLTEQRLVPLEAARHVGYPYDRPRALHRSLLVRGLTEPFTGEWLSSRAGWQRGEYRGRIRPADWSQIDRAWTNPGTGMPTPVESAARSSE